MINIISAQEEEQSKCIFLFCEFILESFGLKTTSMVKSSETISTG